MQSDLKEVKSMDKVFGENHTQEVKHIKEDPREIIPVNPDLVEMGKVWCYHLSFGGSGLIKVEGKNSKELHYYMKDSAVIEFDGQTAYWRKSNDLAVPKEGSIVYFVRNKNGRSCDTACPWTTEEEYLKHPSKSNEN